MTAVGEELSVVLILTIQSHVTRVVLAIRLNMTALNTVRVGLC